MEKTRRIVSTNGPAIYQPVSPIYQPHQQLQPIPDTTASSPPLNKQQHHSSQVEEIQQQPRADVETGFSTIPSTTKTRHRAGSDDEVAHASTKQQPDIKYHLPGRRASSTTRQVFNSQIRPYDHCFSRSAGVFGMWFCIFAIVAVVILTIAFVTVMLIYTERQTGTDHFGKNENLLSLSSSSSPSPLLSSPLISSTIQERRRVKDDGTDLNVEMLLPDISSQKGSGGARTNRIQCLLSNHSDVPRKQTISLNLIPLVREQSNNIPDDRCPFPALTELTNAVLVCTFARRDSTGRVAVTVQRTMCVNTDCSCAKSLDWTTVTVHVRGTIELATSYVLEENSVTGEVVVVFELATIMSENSQLTLDATTESLLSEIEQMSVPYYCKLLY